MFETIQVLWDQMRAELKANAAPQIRDAYQALLSGRLGPLTENQTEDLESIERSCVKLIGRFEGEPINWADYSEAAHALRGPLNSTIGFSRLMLKSVEGPITEAQGEALETIYGLSQHMLAIFNLLLDALLITTQDMGFNVEPVPIDEVLGELSAVGQALSSKIGFIFETDLDTSVGEITLLSDKKRLKQALTALLGVFGKHLNGSALTLQARPDGSSLLIQLQSQGGRLPAPLPTDLSRLLTDEAEADLPYDLHLRLGLAWRLLNEMRGQLEAYQNDESFTFSVTLPVA